MNYAKIRMGGRTYLIEVTQEGGGTISGWRVRKNGDRMDTSTKTTITEYFMVARSDQVIARMQMNLHYGVLEAVE